MGWCPDERSVKIKPKRTRPVRSLFGPPTKALTLNMKKLSRGGLTVGHKAEQVDKAREFLRQSLKEAREAAATRSAAAADSTDAESVEARETYDYIIVGAGTAGCTLAYSLVKGTKNRVLVLEAGPSDTFAHDRITTPFLEPTVRRPSSIFPLFLTKFHLYFICPNISLR